MGRLGYYSKLSGQALQESDPPAPQIFLTALVVGNRGFEKQKKIHLYTLSVSCKNKV